MSRKPPPDLSERSRALWRAVVRSGTRSSTRLCLVEEMCRALDRAAAFRAILGDPQALVVTTKTGMVHVHPAVRAEQEAVETFIRLARLLELQWDDELDGDQRPSVYTSLEIERM
jgi:phage terminase small subunit